MATTTVTLTGDISDAIGVDFDTRRTKIYVRYNTDTVVTDSGPMRLGGGNVTPETDGTFEIPDVVASTSLVENLQATVVVDYPSPSARGGRGTATFGPYDLTGESGTVDIRTLEEVQHLDASRASVLMSEMEALRDEVVDLSNIDTPDALVATLVEDSESATGVALTATIEAAIEDAGIPDGAVTSTSILSIRTTYDPDEAAADGELLVVLPEPVIPGAEYFTDFSSDTVDAAPSGWTSRWAAGTWTVKADGGAMGGKVLRNADSPTARRFLSWDAINADDDRDEVEVVFKWRTTTTDTPARAVVRGSGAAASETGYWGAVNGLTTPQLGKYVAGTHTTPIGGTSTSSFAADTWLISRVRIAGDTLTARTWEAANTEPTSWTVTATDTSITAAGWVGLLCPFGGTQDIDWVGVGTAGRTAPMTAP